MSEEAFPRRLSAILSADAVGYSRLMRDDEEATVRTITAYRNAMTHLIQQYRGRVVDSPGDNILAEFTSVVDAVNCAVEMQRELAERNAELPEDRKMRFRIGINLGDVIEEGQRIYGDGVNVASRMESLADAGGICISGAVHDAVESKIGLEYEFIGEHEVKNIDKPIRAYQVLTHPGDAAHRVIKAKRAVGKACRKGLWGLLAVVLVGAGFATWYFYFRSPPIEPASIKKMAYPLPDKPSIAVLPFLNMSGDPKQEYLCDGITDEIITNLSKVPRLFVIARNSTFTYKGKHVKTQQVGEDLGVRYVLEGSFMKAGNRVRVNAQLIDAVNGFHMWSETYSREFDDLFALQDQIAFKVVAALQVKLTEGDQALIVAGQTKNFDAYTKFLRGLEYIKRFNREGNILARKMAEEVIALDPNYPRGYRLLASTHWLDFRLGMSKNPKQSLTTAVKLYQKVISMDQSEAVAYAFLGTAYTMMRKYRQGVEAVDKAVAVNPNAADAHGLRAFVYYFDGRQKEAIVAINKAIRLNPFPPNWYYAVAAQIYSIAGFYDEAFIYFKKTFKINPNHFAGRVALAATYSMTNEEKMARAEIEKVLKQEPAYCVQKADKSWPFKKQSDKNLFLNALRKAGLPETPSLPLPDEPSIAVLPFVNMSGDPKQEYLNDGLTEQIITSISKLPHLFVISRTSSFKYKSKSMDVRQVGRELGVKYVLEGSFQRLGDRLRITAQLIEASTGKHLWAERYQRPFKDYFAIQDEITFKILKALAIKLTEGERIRLGQLTKINLKALEKILEGVTYLREFNQESNNTSKKLFEEAIALDQNSSDAYSLLALGYVMEVWLIIASLPKNH